MKRQLLFNLMMFSFAVLSAQTRLSDLPKDIAKERDFRIPLIGDKAPSFTGESTQGTIDFPNDYGTYWKVIMSHPMDFTPVCSSEFLEMANLQKKFEKLNVKIIALSTDNLETHVQWKKALEEIKYKDYPATKIRFPIVDDYNKKISEAYGMIHPMSNTTKDVRGVFIIDPSNVIRAEIFYPNEVGRNMDEILRTVEALQVADRNGVRTPANWQVGQDVIAPYPTKAEISANKSSEGDYYQLSWFLTFRKANTLRGLGSAE